MDMHQRFCFDQLGKLRQHLDLTTMRRVTLGNVVPTAAVELFRLFLIAQDFGDARQMLVTQQAYDKFIDSRLRLHGVSASSALLHQIEDVAHYYVLVEDAYSDKNQNRGTVLTFENAPRLVQELVAA